MAGGVGVNPIMSILSHVGGAMAAHHQPPSSARIRFTIAYASRVPEQGGGIGGVLFLDRIRNLLQTGAIKGSLSLFLTQGGGKGDLSEAESKLWEEESGHRVHGRRMTREDLTSLVGNPRRTLAYICGPPIMTDEFQVFLTSSEGLGMDTTQVIVEKWW